MMIKFKKTKSFLFVRHFLFGFLYLILFSQNNLYGICQPYEEDLRHYTSSSSSPNIRPLISGSFITEEDIVAIKMGRKAAVTICTTPLGYNVNHISIVFELIINPHIIQNAISQEDEEVTKSLHLSLFNLHFGGDGDSVFINKKRPIIDNARDTLRKVYRGQKVSITTDAQLEEVPPMYTRRVIFIVDQVRAQEALEQAEKEDGLTYHTIPIWHKWDNCSTYAGRVLGAMGIEISAWYAEKFVTDCYLCSLPEEISRYDPIRNVLATQESIGLRRECTIL